MNIFQTILSKLPAGTLNILQNSAHVPIALLVLGATTIYHFKTGHDLGVNYTNSLWAFYAFLGGHFTASQVWPDKIGGDK